MKTGVAEGVLTLKIMQLNTGDLRPFFSILNMRLFILLPVAQLVTTQIGRIGFSKN